MRFMVTVQLDIPAERREEFAAKLPAENAYIVEEIHCGHLEGIYYAAGAPTVWAVIHADSLEAAQRQVEAYPLYSFMRLMYTPLR